MYTYSKVLNQIYPESISSYTDHADAPASLTVDFALTGRDNRLVDYGAGFEVVTYYAIDTITMSVDATWVRKYDFDYTKSQLTGN